MLFNVLASTADKTREVPIGEASLYALLGFLIVFVGIALLILVVWAVGKVMVAMQNGKTASKTKKADDVKAVAPLQSAPKQDDADDETVAVIMAALMAYYQKNNPKCEFTVKRIKRL